jgi:hypothetical protein
MVKPHLSRARCDICGGPLTVHEEVRGRICAKPSCRSAALQREVARRERETERERALAAALLKQRVREAFDTLIPPLGRSGRAAPPIALVPAASQPLVKLSRRRRSAFRRHLASVVTEAFEQSADSPAALPAEELPMAAQFEDETSTVRAGCATCRGNCCRYGADRNAFLDALTIRRYLAAHPTRQPRKVVQAYLDRIPETGVRDSCVFHGESGCTLSRRMRAAICNIYHCDGLKEIEALRADPQVREILIVATTETDIVRWSRYDVSEGDASPADPLERAP